MSSEDECPDMMTPDITANVEEKVRDYLAYPKVDEQELRLVVYGDKELVTQQMWNSIFRDDLPYVDYRTFFPIIPIPAHYTPECYTQYEKELRQCVATWATKENFIWDLYNVAATEQVPRMHLLLANRLVKRSEFGRWFQTDKSGSWKSYGAHLDPRFISIYVLRMLVWKLLDFDCFPSTLRGRQFDQPLDLSRTLASGAERQARRSTSPSRQTEYKYPEIIEKVTANINVKVINYELWFPDDDKQQPKVLMFGDKEPLSRKMWEHIFGGRLMFYLEFFCPLPIPDNYTPECYQEYEQEMRKHVASCLENSDLIWGLYNLAAPDHDPRMHLVLANRPVKRSELWCWAQTDQSESSASDKGYQDSRFISLESLRGLVSNLLDVSPLSSIPEGSSATSSSSTSRGESGRQFARALIIEEVATNIQEKVNDFQTSWFPNDDKQFLIVLVYGDKEPLFRKMWEKLFRAKLLFYVDYASPLPIPRNYTPECYQEYEQVLREHVAHCVGSSDLIWGLYNLAVPGQYPRMHLVLANRPVKRSDLWCGAQTEQSERSESDMAYQDPRFISFESLHGLVSNLVDVYPLWSIPEGSSATSSTSTSRGESGRY